MIYPFGKDFTHTFYPTIDDEPIQLPSQAPSIFLFDAEHRPDTTSDAQAGTGASGSEINYWSQSGTAPYGCSFTIPAISDPDPDSSESSQGYWLAVNFVAQTSGSKLTSLQFIECARIRPTDGIPGTTKDELKSVYPAISSYITDTQLDQFLVIAEDEMRLELEGKGFEWTKLFSLQKFALPLAYKTISLAALSQMRETDDKHAKRYEEFKDKYDSITKALVIKQDTDGDGEPDAYMKPRKTYAVISR